MARSARQSRWAAQPAYTWPFFSAAYLYVALSLLASFSLTAQTLTIRLLIGQVRLDRSVSARAGRTISAR